MAKVILLNGSAHQHTLLHEMKKAGDQNAYRPERKTVHCRISTGCVEEVGVKHV